jgi:molecular chaperone DnaJ
MDLYDVLGVRRNATEAEVRRGYQRRARALHPALNPGDPVAADRFKAVVHAFEVLSDPQSRAAYDRGEVAPLPTPRAPEGGFEGFDFTAGVRVDRVSFREIFDAALAPPPGDTAPARGEDLEQSTRIGFDESLSGTRRRVHFVRQDQCTVCQGRGEVAFGPIACPRCRGTGQVRGSRGHMIFSRRCVECAGAGHLTRRPCPRCGAEGRLMASEWLDVEIPPGVRNGHRVRVPGCGNAGRRGGPPGDFLLSIEVEPHPFFRREDEDLHGIVPVTMTEAALGGHIEVPTPDGPVTIEVPAGTQTGQRFRLRKRGVPRLGGPGRGDLYVEVRVWIPTVTDDKGRELLQEFTRIHPHDPRKDSAVAGSPKAAEPAARSAARAAKRAEG